MTPRAPRIALVAIGLSVLAATAARTQASVATPGSLPSPTGPRGIGRVTYYWTDSARIEPLAADRRNREVMVDVWYPTDHQTGSRAQYLDALAFAAALGARGLPALVGERAA